MSSVLERNYLKRKVGVAFVRSKVAGSALQVCCWTKKIAETVFCLQWEKNKAVKIFFSTISFDIRCPAQKNFIDVRRQKRYLHC